VHRIWNRILRPGCAGLAGGNRKNSDASPSRLFDLPRETRKREKERERERDVNGLRSFHGHKVPARMELCVTTFQRNVGLRDGAERRHASVSTAPPPPLSAHIPSHVCIYVACNPVRSGKHYCMRIGAPSGSGRHVSAAEHSERPSSPPPPPPLPSYSRSLFFLIIYESFLSAEKSRGAKIPEPGLRVTLEARPKFQRFVYR